MSAAQTWGTTAAERATAFPYDPADDAERVRLWRGIDAPVVFRRQLLNLKRLAEREFQNTAPRAGSESGSERSSA